MRAYTEKVHYVPNQESSMKKMMLFSAILSMILFCPILWAMEKTLEEPFVFFELEETVEKPQSRRNNSVSAFIIARLSTNQHLIILGEFPVEYRQFVENAKVVRGDKRVMRAIINLMEQAEKIDTDKPAFHILVEHIHELHKMYNLKDQEISDSYIMTGLIPHALKRGYRRSEVENCENRAESYIASMIMNLMCGQFETYENDTYTHDRIKECYNCDLLTLTWRDILSCHERLSAECQAYRDQWKDRPDITEQFDELFQKVNYRWREAKESIVPREVCTTSEETLHPIKPDEPIFTTMKNLDINAHLRFIEGLDDLLRDAFYPFIEARLLHRILTLRQEAQVPVIVTYTRYTHAIRLYHALNDMESVIAETAVCEALENFSPKEFRTIADLIPYLHEDLSSIPHIPKKRDLDKEKINNILLVIAGSCTISVIGGLILLAVNLKQYLNKRAIALAQTSKNPTEKSIEAYE